MFYTFEKSYSGQCRPPFYFLNRFAYFFTVSLQAFTSCQVSLSTQVVTQVLEQVQRPAQVKSTSTCYLFKYLLPTLVAVLKVNLVSFLLLHISVVVDVTNTDSMEMAGYWKQQVINTITTHTEMTTTDALKLPILLIGNKYDLVSCDWLKILTVEYCKPIG